MALEAAARAPQRTTQLALLAIAAPMAVPKALLELALSDPLAAIDRVVTFSYSTLAAKPSYPGPGVWLRGAGRALRRQVLAHQGDPLLFHTDFAACDRYVGAVGAAAKVSCPTTLVLAQADQMTPVRAAAQIAVALHARVHTVAAGHSMMEESPDAVLSALRGAFGPRHGSEEQPSHTAR